MKTILFYTFFVLCLLGSLFACYSSHDGPTDSNTNWLGACEEDSDCRGSQGCICGVCTTYCTGTNECKQYHEDAVCIGMDRERAEELCEDINLDGPISFCALGCETDRDCIASGKDLSCIAGFCVANGKESPDNRDDFVVVPVMRLGQQGESCSDSAPCEEPLVCGYSGTCELHQVVSHTSNQVVMMAANNEYIYWSELNVANAILDFATNMLNYAFNMRGDNNNNNIGFPMGLEILDGILARAPIEGSPRQVIDDKIAWPVELMVDDTHVYYGESFGIASIGVVTPFTLRRAAHTSTIGESEASGAKIHENLFQVDDVFIAASIKVVQDSTHVFIVYTDGRVIAIDKSTGESEQVAQLWSQVVVVPGVAVDQDCLYVCTSHVDTDATERPYDLDVRCYDRQNWQETVIVNLGKDIRGSSCALEVTDDYLIVQSLGLGLQGTIEVASVIVIDKESGETRPLVNQSIAGAVAAQWGTIGYSPFGEIGRYRYGTFQAYGEYIYWIAETPDDPLQYLIHRMHLESEQTDTMLKISAHGIEIEDIIGILTDVIDDMKSAIAIENEDINGLPTENITAVPTDDIIKSLFGMPTDADGPVQLLPPVFLINDNAIFWHDPENDNAIMRLELP